ncbi:MAG: hypothetical protein WBB30_11460 [Solirubrobacterales bacterium]
MSKQPMIISRDERMFAHRSRLFKGLLGLLALFAALPVIGCGSDDGPANTDQAAAAEAPAPDVSGADPADVAVISDWAEALAGGDVEAAADYFALPSIAENGAIVTRIRTLEAAVAFNAGLPCGAVVTSAETTGDFTTATFELFERPGGACGPGVGGTAATSFVIEDGKITEWRRVGEGGGGPDQSTT